MAVTTTFLSFTSGVLPDPSRGPGSSLADVVALANGGYAVISNAGGDSDIDIFNADNSDAGGASNLGGTRGAIDQLGNNNIVVAFQDANSIVFRIVDGTGGIVVANVDVGDAGSSNADVAALGNGSQNFVIVSQDDLTGGDFDIDVDIFGPSGAPVTDFIVDVSAAADTNPAVCALDDGGFAVAWERTNGVNTEIWTAVYNANGSERRAPQLFDNAGSINRNVDIAAVAGGFAVVYEDNGFSTGTVDIKLAVLDSAGVFQRGLNVSSPTNVNDGSNDERPTLVRMSNGFLVVGWEYNAFPDTHSLLALVDPATGVRVSAPVSVLAGEPFEDDIGEIAIAVLADDRNVYFHTNVTDGDVDGAVGFYRRVSDSDGAGDTITGDSLRDTMNGNGGNDTLNGAGGDDILDSGDGNDTVNAGAGNDTVTDSTINDPGNVDSYDGGDDIDTLVYTDEFASFNVFDLSTGEVRFNGVANDTFANFENISVGGAAQAIGDGNANVIIGLGISVNHANTFSGGGGGDTIEGGAGDDTITGGIGVDTLNGGAGLDAFQYVIAGEAAANETVDGGTETDAILLFQNQAYNFTGVTITNVETLLYASLGVTTTATFLGTQFGAGKIVTVFGSTNGTNVLIVNAADSGVNLSGVTFTFWTNGTDSITINGTGAGESLTGSSQNDIINAGNGNDTVNGGAGRDVMRGGDGLDTYFADVFNDVVSEANANLATGGNDLVNFSGTTGTFVLGTNVERLTLSHATAATNGTGNALANTIKGNNGANTLNGLAGNDILQGFGRNDTYVVDATADRVIEAVSGGLDLVRSSATFTLAVNVENLTLTGAAAIRGTGNATANTINGNNAANVLAGLAGNDTLNGGGGSDLIVGGLGKDVMNGGLGNDRFDFNSVAEIGKGISRDVITGFTHLTDKIDLGTIDANVVAASHTFVFLAANNAAFTGVAGQLRWFRDDQAGTADDKTIIEGDINGNKVADFQIQLAGLKPLTSADFVL